MSENTLLVVGASSAIGMEILRQVAAPDQVILAHCHTGADRLEELAARLPGRIVPIPADLSRPEGVDALVEAAAAQAESPGAVVFLAAPRLALGRFREFSWEDFARHSDLQLRTAVALLRAFLPAMAARRSGRVVFMLSQVTLGVPPGGMAPYVTAKYALLGLMKALAAEYAPRGVCINAVSPSMVETGFLAEIPGKIVELAAQQNPMGRNATPGDVAPVVKFLLSEEAGFVTGVNIPVTGGGR